jgi:hypothetical protein
VNLVSKPFGGGGNASKISLPPGSFSIPSRCG